MVCGSCGQILRMDVPWAIKSRTGFTLLFDAWIIAMAKDMPMNAVSRMVKETDKRLWRILSGSISDIRCLQILLLLTMIY